MSFEGAVVATGALVILLIFLANKKAPVRKTKEPDTTLTRLEQQYFEPEVYAAQQAEIEAERHKNTEAAEAFLKSGNRHFYKGKEL